MAPRFTEEQQLAIDVRDRTLLVSAAAGSGKTATLTGRIIASLTDPRHPTSLSRLVVATFTNDSAADMRRKIASALEAAAAADPENIRLSREQLLLPSARISTIDSFCVRLLRQNAEAAGIPAAFRVADSAETSLLGGEVMEGLLDELYAAAVPGVEREEFYALADALSSAKSEDSLPALLLSLYEEVLHDVRGISALRDAAEAYAREEGKPFFATVFGAEVADYYAAALRDIAGAMREAVAPFLGSDEPSMKKRAPFCREEADCLAALADRLLSRDPAPLLPTLGKIPSARGDLPDAYGLLGALHNEAKDLLSELGERYLTYSDEEFSALLPRLSATADLLFRILSQYDLRLTAEKRRRGILGFLDIERRAYALLTEEGEPTPLARELAAGIDYIYIDEFQDVNALQYGIFRAIAREDNLFMVGDVKQCIYAFRHADPGIFSSLRAAFPPLSGEGPAATHFFSKNFRCDRPIVSYVNRVAGRLLAAAGGSPYTAADDLAFGKLPPFGEEPVRTHVFALPTRGKGAPALTEEEAERLSVRECEWIAAEIGRLLREGRKNDGSPIRPSDITLLFRNGRRMPQYAAALSGVAPVSIAAERDFFLNTEVLLALSLLYTVDNPRRDIYLAAALRSPVFGFTMQDLTALRVAQKKAPTLYDALVAEVEEHPDLEKGKRFLKTLAGWRRIAEGETVGNLVLAVFQEAGLLTLGGEGASSHHDNLFRLYQYARSFEASSYAGLYSFISYLNTAIEKGETILKPATEGKEEAVRFMTVHGSKGLEFPVVFLCDTHHAFNTAGRRPSLLYDRGYGPVIRFPTAGGALADNPIRTLVRDRRTREETAEEIRLLYVALTRARERLYVTGSVTKPDEKCAAAEAEMALFRPWHILSHNSTLSWILPILAGSGDPYLTIHPLPSGETPQETVAPAAEGEEIPVADEAEVKRLLALLRERLSFVYPDEAATSLPEKLSVSRLTPAVLDGSDGEEPSAPLPGRHRPSVPRFLSGTREDAAAAAGTATHLFMQFCDFDRLASSSVEEELRRLVKEEFLHPSDAALVRRDEIELFRTSALFARLRAATRLRRELRFHARLPAALFTEDTARAAALGDRELLVQGVIDCLIEEEDGYTVIDYKTDRLTPAELQDPRLAREKLLSRHAAQLTYYAAACERMYGKKPKSVEIYSLPMACTITL